VILKKVEKSHIYRFWPLLTINLRMFERIAFAIVPVEVRYPDRIVGMALLLWSMQ
jgi:hypothetical protein